MGLRDFFKKNKDISVIDNNSKAYEKVSDTEPKYAYVWYNKGGDLYGLGRYEEAIKAYDKALEIDPKYVYAWHGKGAVFENLGRYEEAIKAYDKALEIDPKCASAWNGKGAVLHNLDRYEEAIQFYDKALDLNPKYVSAWNNKGNTLMFWASMKMHYKLVISPWISSLNLSRHGVTKVILIVIWASMKRQ